MTIEKETYEIRICRSREEHFYIEASSEEEAEKIANENAEALFEKIDELLTAHLKEQRSYEQLDRTGDFE